MIEGNLACAFDTPDRLTSADHPAGQTYNPDESYAYDAVGNRTSSHRSSGHAVNALNQLTRDDDFDYAYDADGNLTAKTDRATGAVTAYAWDAENRLTQVALPDGANVYFKYDVMGRRVEKRKASGGTTTIRRYAYDGQNLIAEYDGNNALLARYYYGLGIDNVLAMKRGGSLYYYHKDALGSVAAVTDESGSAVQRYVYDSFGNIVHEQDPDFESPFAYTGREWDGETGLYYYRARYYMPETGRFLSEDPVWGVNLYGYVANNPEIHIDPLGKDVFISFTCQSPNGEPDSPFAQAAGTWERETMAQYGDNDDRIIQFTYSNDKEFADNWNSITEILQENEKVGGVAIFGHGKPGSIVGHDGEETNLTTEEIIDLSVLPWSQNATIDIHTCRSGNPAGVKWVSDAVVFMNPSVAEAFRMRQQVTTIGTQGPASFSLRKDEYRSIVSRRKGRSIDKHYVYLRAFNKGLANPISWTNLVGIWNIFQGQPKELQGQGAPAMPELVFRK